MKKYKIIQYGGTQECFTPPYTPIPQGVNTCWFNSAFNGILLGKYMNLLVKCLLNNTTLLDENGSRNACPLEITPDYLIGLFGKINKNNQFNMSTINKNVKEMKANFGLKTPLYTAPKAISQILRILIEKFNSYIHLRNFMFVTYEQLLKIDEIKLNKNYDIIIVQAPKIAFTFTTTKLEQTLNIDDNTFLLDHSVIADTQNYFMHYKTGIYRDECQCIYDSLENSFETINWVDATNVRFAYIMYVNQKYANILEKCSNNNNRKKKKQVLCI